MSQSARWIFTVNNWNEDTCLALAALVPAPAKYVAYGKEVAPTTGTPYLQGYVVFVANKRLPAVKKILPSAHWEVAKGSSEQNVAYCSKDGDFTEHGEPPKTKAQNGADEKARWKQIIQDAKDGVLEETDPKMYYLHFNTNNRLQAQYEKPTFVEREVHVYWGGTGTGKSHKAWEQAGSEAYPKDPRSKFWYGYHGQENCIIDEYRGGIDISHFLRWTDRYPLLVEVKNSSCVLKAKKIWITSNLHPKDWYPDLDPETLAALLRRLKITHFHGDVPK